MKQSQKCLLRFPINSLINTNQKFNHVYPGVRKSELLNQTTWFTDWTVDGINTLLVANSTPDMDITIRKRFANDDRDCNEMKLLPLVDDGRGIKSNWVIMGQIEPMFLCSVSLQSSFSILNISVMSIKSRKGK